MREIYHQIVHISFLLCTHGKMPCLQRWSQGYKGKQFLRDAAFTSAFL